MKNYLEMPWSVEDTIENLKLIKECVKEIVRKANLDGKGEEDCNEAKFDFDRAIEALEKQIPKKPYIQQDDRNNDCMECPSCDSFIGYEYDCRDGHYQINYCNYCGQKLDWRGGEYIETKEEE